MDILIVKIGAIGDVVMALPMIPCLKEQHRNCKISWMCGEAVAPVLRMVEGIDELIVINERLLFKESLPERIKYLLSLMLKNSSGSYDLLINLHSDWRYSLLSLGIRRKRYACPRQKGDIKYISGRYHLNSNIALASGVSDSGLKSYRVPQMEESLLDKTKWLENGTIVLSPGGAKNMLAEDISRRWPAEYYARLAQILLQNGFRVAIVGSETDSWVLDYFKGLALTNLIGKTTIPELISVLQQCSLLVTHDTGILHLGKLVNKKTVAIFGPINPRERVGTEENIMTIWGGQNLPCSPCYDGKNFVNCRNNICMKMVTPEFVYGKVLEKMAMNG